MSEQLNLFDWKPKCLIVAFPLSRRQQLIIRAAHTVSRSGDEEGAAYWQRLVNEVARPLIAVGVPTLEVDREIYEFREAVQAELYRIEDALFRDGGRA